VVKVLHGGWVPLALAAVVFLVMATWRRGREILRDRLAEGALPLELALPDIIANTHRVRGTGVFLHGNPTTTPPALLHSLKHLKVIHERVIFLRVEVLDRAYVEAGRRSTVEDLGDEFYRVVLRYGFAEVPDVAEDLKQAPLGDRPLKVMETTYLLGRERLIATHRPGMAMWREKLFSALSNNATSAADFFGLPPGQVIEIGARVEI
jgi:KUP system potassium uptake protein